MARIRTIKPEIWTHEKFVSCSMAARYLFLGMLNQADDEGRLEYEPMSLKMRVLPADSVDPVALLDELTAPRADKRRPLVQRYTVAGRDYLAMNFADHQRIEKPAK